MRALFIFFLLLSPSLAHAGYALVKSTPVVSAGVSGTTAIVQVAQPYTFSGVTAANAPFSMAASNNAQYALGSGAGSPASQIAQAALGVGTAGAALVSSPALAALVGIASVGVAGYDLYQALKSQGVVVSPDGSAVSPHVIQTWTSPASSVQAVSLPDFCVKWDSTSVASWKDATHGWCTTPAGASIAPSVTSTSTVTQPMTNQDLINAINTATTNAIAAADAVSFAQSRGINPLSYFPSTQPNLSPAPYSVTLPDGTVVTVTPKTTFGGQDAFSPTPTSTTSTPAPIPQPAPTPAPAPAAKSLCETNPTASACADLGTAPAASPLPSNTVDVSGTNFGGYVFSGNAVCPADVVKKLGNGANITISYAPFCTFLSAFRPVAIIVSLLIASLIMFGQRSSDNA